MPECMTTTTQSTYQSGKKRWPRLPIKFSKTDRRVYTILYFITEWSPKKICFQKSITLCETFERVFKRKIRRQVINRSLKKLEKYLMISLADKRKKTRYWKVNFCESLLISPETVALKMEGIKKPKKKFSTSKTVPNASAESSHIPPQDVPTSIELESTKIIGKTIIYSEEHSLALKEDLWPKSGSKADDDFSKKTKTKQPVKQPYAEFKKEQELKAKKKYEEFLEAKQREFGDELVSFALTNVEARVKSQLDKGVAITCEYSYKKKALENEIKKLSLKPQCQKNKAVEEGNASLQKKNLASLDSMHGRCSGALSFSQHGTSIKLIYHGETNNELDLNMDPSLFISTAERFARSVNKALGLQKQTDAPTIQKPSDPQPTHKPNNAQAAQMQNMLGDLKGMFSTKWGSASY